jgi:hypothetical protein
LSTFTFVTIPPPSTLSLFPYNICTYFERKKKMDLYI